MKRISTFLLALVATLSLAFAGDAEMVIRSQSGSFLLKINGQLLNTQPLSQVVIPDLEPGNHHIAIRMANGSRESLQFDRVFLPHNQRVIFELVRRDRYQISLEKVGSEPLYAQQYPARPAGPAYPSYDEPMAGQCMSPMHPSEFAHAMQAVRQSRSAYDQLRTAKQIVRSNCMDSRQLAKMVKTLSNEEQGLELAKLGWEYVTDPQDFQIVVMQFDRRAYARSLQDYMQYHPRQTRRHDNAYGDNYGDSYDNDYQRSLRPEDFRLILRDVRNESFESDKLRVAKQAVERNPLSSEQVLQLMEQLTFERDRLELAKFAYRYVVDPQRYHTVEQAFTYSSSKRELARIIR